MSRKGVTKLEMQLRRKQLRLLLRKGYSPAEMRNFAEEKYHLSPLRAQRLVAEIMEEVIANMGEYTYQQLAATLFDRFEYLHRQTVAAKDYETAHGILKSIAAQFLSKKPEIVITGGGDVDEDKLGDFNPGEPGDD